MSARILYTPKTPPPIRTATSNKVRTSRRLTDLLAPACSTKRLWMDEPSSLLERPSTNVSLTMLDSVTTLDSAIGIIAGLLFDFSRLDSVPIPWARKPLWIGGIHVRKAIRLGPTLEGG